MQRIRARIESLTREPTGRPGIRVLCPPALRPSPGQAALAVGSGRGEPARTALFPTRLDPRGFTADLPDDVDWSPGADLDLLTPVGNAFMPPASARQWLLAAIDVPPWRLLPLLDLGLARGAAVVLAAPVRPTDLPAAVEVVIHPSEALAWADYLAVDVSLSGLPGLRQGLCGSAATPPPLPRHAQALIALPMPCGLGVCGACAVHGHRRWHLACSDGPVFDLHRLEM